MLSVKGLSFHYPDSEPLFEDISFSLQAGEALGIIGPSGCGKSTLALALCGIIPHRIEGRIEGDVFILGEDIRKLTLPQIATRVGIVFQDPETQLFLPQIIYELAFGPENLCLPREKITRVVNETAALTGLESLLAQHPYEISGGQQQLVALSAVLCLDPSLLILDEVASQLDQESSARILSIVQQLKHKGKTVVMIDHNLKRLQLADRILVMGFGLKHHLGNMNDILDHKELLEEYFGNTPAERVL
ncbi:MAG: ABC transporter ATP-binding protein [Bacillota bacterium]|nr:ABC transporter ATP-binding protein [Bacillota bacterium]